VSNYPQLREEQAQARSQGRLVGIGLCCYVEITGYGWETGGVRVNPDGSVVILTGTSPHGQGTQNAFVQIVADLLGIAPERFSVVQGDTLAVPYGMGTAGSRTLSVGGSAVKKAGEIVRDKLIKIAAHLLEAAPEDIELGEQGWGVRGTDKRVGMEQILATAFSHRKLPPGMEPGLEGQSSFSLKDANYPFGSHLAMVEVDRETGLVQILRHLAVDDCGVVVNPLLYEGQQHGGIAQGIGQALYEGIHYDREGQNLTASFLEYALPKAAQIPRMEPYPHQTPSPTNPLGVKGVGEAGAIGATPAAVGAVVDALGIAHLDMPLTPEKVWKQIPRQSTVRQSH
jgi:carbon-monoxide dehydrogenase large subunit